MTHSKIPLQTLVCRILTGNREETCPKIFTNLYFHTSAYSKAKRLQADINIFQKFHLARSKKVVLKNLRAASPEIE